MRQSLELHFGDDYAQVWEETSNWIKIIRSRPQWWVDVRQLIASEGSVADMTEQAMYSIIEVGDAEGGRKAYLARLSKEYGSKAAAHMRKRIDLPDFAFEHTSIFAVSDTLEVSSQVQNQAVPPEVEKALSDKEKEFIVAWKRMGIKEAGEALFGWDKETSFKKYSQLVRRLKRYREKYDPITPEKGEALGLNSD
jgi:hypothetical protein